MPMARAAPKALDRLRRADSHGGTDRTGQGPRPMGPRPGAAVSTKCSNDFLT